MWSRGWSRLRRAGWALVLGGAVTLAVGLPMRGLTADGPGFDRIVGWSNILAFSVGVAGLLLLSVDRSRAASKPTDVAIGQAVEELAVQVLDREGRERARLLGTGAPSIIPANVRFDRTDELVRFEQVGSGRRGQLNNVREFFQDHTAGRMVILGEPGSGKTVLCLELLTQLLERRRDRDTEAERERDVVPVRFSLSAWNTDQPLASWLTAQVISQFGLPDPVAAAVIQGKRLLPVLDGLDEMDPPNQPPVRAQAAVRQLNEYVTGRRGAPLVLTCRTADYAGIGEAVRPAVEVRIQPLTAGQIGDYLHSEAGARQPDGAGWADWRDVLAMLEHPHDRRLLAQLDSPWRLTLAATLHNGGGDVNTLLPVASERPDGGQTPTPEQAEKYAERVTGILLGAFIPARTQLYAAGRYTPAQVAHWLAVVAGHLSWQAGHNMSNSDVVLHDWWRVAGGDRVKRAQAVLAAILMSAAAVTAGIAVNGGVGAGLDNVRFYVSLFPSLPGAYLAAGVCFVFTVAYFPYVAAQAARRDNLDPTRINVQQMRTYRGRRRLVGRLGSGLAIGLAGGLVIGLAIGFAAGLVVGLVVGLVFGLAGGLEPLGAVVVVPRDAIRNDSLVALALVLVSVAAGGLVGAGLAEGLTTPLTGWLAVGLAGGIASTLLSGMGTASLRYLIAVSLGAREEMMPLRFGAFLHWASRAGIVRMAGNAYQFRHSELRDWLACPRH